MSEFDLRKPRVLDSADIAQLYGLQKWEVEEALVQLMDGGVLEEMGETNFGTLVRLRRELLIHKGERATWIKGDEELKERGRLNGEKGENLRERNLRIKLTRAQVPLPLPR